MDNRRSISGSIGVLSSRQMCGSFAGSPSMSVEQQHKLMMLLSAYCGGGDGRMSGFGFVGPRSLSAAVVSPPVPHLPPAARTSLPAPPHLLRHPSSAHPPLLPLPSPFPNRTSPPSTADARPQQRRRKNKKKQHRVLQSPLSPNAKAMNWEPDAISKNSKEEVQEEAEETKNTLAELMRGEVVYLPSPPPSSLPLPRFPLKPRFGSSNGEALGG